LGINPTEFDAEVIRKTNETAARAFPSILNTDHPEFFRRLHCCSDLNGVMAAIDQTAQPKWLRALRKLLYQLAIAAHLLRIYLIKPINAEVLRETVR